MRKKKDDMTPLSPAEAAFVAFYVLHRNATKAALQVGKSRNWGPLALKRPNVAAVIAYATKEADQEAHALTCEAMERVIQPAAEVASAQLVTIEEVVAYFRENIARAFQAVPVLDSKGEPTGEYKWDGAVVNAAARALGDSLGMFKTKQEHTGPNGGPIQTEVVVTRRIVTVDPSNRLAAVGDN